VSLLPKKNTQLGTKQGHYTPDKMKIHLGFPNPDSINKLAPALQALDLNLLKAEPSKIALKGLHRIPQDGYAEYSSHIPAFMYATELNKAVPLTREGYPVLTKVEVLFPLKFPPVYITFRGSKDLPDAIKASCVAKPISVKDKNLKAYTLEYQSGLLGLVRNSNYEPGVFPIANTVSADDLASLITIVRILSGFLRAHKYPAFPTSEEFDYEYAAAFDSIKRPLVPENDEYYVDDQGNPTKRMANVTVDGEPTWVRPDLGTGGAQVHLRRAKPSDMTIKAWGDASDIPNTDGIVFPYVEELAIWDKEAVCNTIGLYFVRCLGHTTDGCLKMYSEICQHWKRSIHRSSTGNALSHIFKIIDIAIPAQARVFPIIVNGQYSGCYLSGAGYSVALRSELFRPTTYENNKEDFDCFDSTDALLMKILGVLTADKTKEVTKKIRKMAEESMRGLDAYLKGWVLTIEKLEKIRTLAARIRYPQEFLRINMENIQLALSWLKDGVNPPMDIPMHAYALGRTSRIELVFSAFGPTAPSPNIPGSQKIQVTPKVPANFNKLLAFRTTSLETAISDWKEFGDKGFVYNGPDRLSGRYQYVQVRGEADKDAWFSVLSGYHVWFQAEQRKAQEGEAKRVNLDELEGAILGMADGGIDLSGF